MTPDQVIDFSSKLSNMYGEKAQPFTRALEKIAESDGSRRNALLYGIYQQPAFRKMLEDIGRTVIGEEDESDQDTDTNISSDIE